MSYGILLEKIYDGTTNKQDYTNKLNSNLIDFIDNIAEKSFDQKGVFTVLITLLVYKIINPKQDIRIHQTQLPNGFSGRSIDTKYITPTLKKIGLPSMAESGWLTRSLEQPSSYTLDYEGKINNKKVKKAFLNILYSIEEEKVNPKFVLNVLLKKTIEIQKQHKVIITPLKEPEKLTIMKIINILEIQFHFNYHNFGGSKLPVLAFYSIYTILLKEISRYNNCILKPLGSHTSSDRTSKSAGDIEVFKVGKLFEAIEIKLGKEIDNNMLRIAKEKIIRYNPKRYYILFSGGVKKDDIEKNQKIIQEVKEIHGCQIIINGIIPTLKYYLRLVNKVNDFYYIYSHMIDIDTELKMEHKKKWNELVKELNNEV